MPPGARLSEAERGSTCLTAPYDSMSYKPPGARLSEAERGSTCLTAPYDSMSYKDFIWDANSESCLATALKQVKIRPDEDRNGPLNTHPNGKRTATGLGF